MRIFLQYFQLVFFSAAVFSPAAAAAHDGWIEVTPSIVEKGQPVTIALMHGNHSNEHKSYRLAGKWDLEFTKITVIAPSGKATDLTGAMIDLGEDPEKTGPKGPKGFQIAQFISEEQGVYTVVARQERVLQHGDGPKFRGVRFARSAFAALPVPTAAEAQKLERFAGEARAGDDLEFRPVMNALGIARQNSVTLELRYKGKPAANQTVSIIQKIAGAASARNLTTDEQGRITFVPPSADSYLARAKIDEKAERSEGQFDLSSYEATYVFQVFNRR
jgi:uncharacterized GH25 family protein